MGETVPEPEVPRRDPRWDVPRRWPAAAVAVAVVVSLVLTVVLVLHDHGNAVAASSARANGARDATALAALRSMGATLAVDDTMRDVGILGLRPLGVSEFRDDVVAPLGGNLEASGAQWTLALGGGWACLRWGDRHGRLAPVVTRGVCPNDLIVSTPVVERDALVQALRVERRQLQAALDAAEVTAALVPTTSRAPFTLVALTHRFARHLGGFRAWPTPYGVTVATSGSVACASPAVTSQSVVITPGPCT